MDTILMALFGYALAKIQTSDPILFKFGIWVILILAALEYIGEIILKVTFKMLADKKK
jgi:hypothetical protein